MFSEVSSIRRAGMLVGLQWDRWMDGWIDGVKWGWSFAETSPRRACCDSIPRIGKRVKRAGEIKMQSQRLSSRIHSSNPIAGSASKS